MKNPSGSSDDASSFIASNSQSGTAASGSRKPMRIAHGIGLRVKKLSTRSRQSLAPLSPNAAPIANATTNAIG